VGGSPKRRAGTCDNAWAEITANKWLEGLLFTAQYETGCAPSHCVLNVGIHALCAHPDAKQKKNVALVI